MSSSAQTKSIEWVEVVKVPEEPVVPDELPLVPLIVTECVCDPVAWVCAPAEPDVPVAGSVVSVPLESVDAGPLASVVPIPVAVVPGFV